MFYIPQKNKQPSIERNNNKITRFKRGPYSLFFSSTIMFSLKLNNDEFNNFCRRLKRRGHLPAKSRRQRWSYRQTTSSSLARFPSRVLIVKQTLYSKWELIINIYKDIQTKNVPLNWKMWAFLLVAAGWYDCSSHRYWIVGRRVNVVDWVHKA